MADKSKDYKQALIGKKVPILTLDQKWHQVFSQLDADGSLKRLEDRLNQLLKEQGKATNDLKDIKKLKSKLMQDLLPLANEIDLHPDNHKTEKKLEETKRLIEECSEKIEKAEDLAHDLPKEIQDANLELMIATMELCYETIEQNQKDINAIGKWISQVRIELKKNLVRKQERESKNQEIYSYMHDIFGSEVIEIFDLQHPTENAGLKKETEKSTE